MFREESFYQILITLSMEEVKGIDGKISLKNAMTLQQTQRDTYFVFNQVIKKLNTGNLEKTRNGQF